ncbi:uncharacterized protein LOC141592454 [Silene latifolia]|uniref:uncharacterized protein LOC141592454 n=1 Tax=Silene latifolia TaxID=37657 RepID=UPI003D78A32A
MAKGVIKKRKVKKNNRKTINKIKKKKNISLSNQIRGIMNYLKSDFYLYSYCFISSPSTDYSTPNKVHKSVGAAQDSELRSATNSVLSEDEHVDLQTNKGMQNSICDEVGDLGKGGGMHDAIGDKQEDIGKDGEMQDSRGDKQGDFSKDGRMRDSRGEKYGHVSKGGRMRDVISDKQGDIGEGGRMQDSIGEKAGDLAGKDSRIQDSIGYKQRDLGAPSPRDVVIRSPSSVMTIRPGKKQAPQSVHVNGVRPKSARAQASSIVLSAG